MACHGERCSGVRVIPLGHPYEPRGTATSAADGWHMDLLWFFPQLMLIEGHLSQQWLCATAPGR